MTKANKSLKGLGARYGIKLRKKELLRYAKEIIENIRQKISRCSFRMYALLGFKLRYNAYVRWIYSRTQYIR